MQNPWVKLHCVTMIFWVARAQKLPEIGPNQVKFIFNVMNLCDFGSVSLNIFVAMPYNQTKGYLVIILGVMTQNALDQSDCRILETQISQERVDVGS